LEAIVAGQKENELYAKWLEADPAERRDVEAKLHAAVKRHAQAVLWNKLKEAPADLVDAIAVAVMTQLEKFRRGCKFSTWVDEIARRKAKEYIRGKVRARKVFDEYVAVVENDRDDYLKPRVGEIVPSVSPESEGKTAVQQFVESLSSEDRALLLNKFKGLKSKEIAEAMRTTVEAVDSRWASLKPRVKNLSPIRRK
jgi:RNA polymerase sigma factor (sigma-70 family)